MAEAILGRDAEDWFNSELGKYMLGRCEQEIAEAQDALSRVSPWRRNRIRQLQNMVWRAQAMKGWMGELVNNGKAAEAALEEQEND